MNIQNTGTTGGQPIDDPLHRYLHRHPGTQHAMRMLRPNPNLSGVPGEVSRSFWVMAEEIVISLGDGPELSAGLRRLLEAKDCLVRQSLADDGRI